ncbi:MAG: nucleotidyl transferase AbiEii/AbiGii toxin family protein [Rhodospirillaceae bacterium]|nr:nucleotidyl transferase AbiEii/AbiGii toxin family protein [Rhodospirillaceae bacterium]
MNLYVAASGRKPKWIDVYIQDDEVDENTATATVLSPARTFREKAALVHVACHRRQLADRPERLSRHWFDLTCLAARDVGRAAISERALLADVVRHKKVFFHAGNANYDQCLDGQLRLVPDNDQPPALQSDDDAMRAARIVGADAPSFDLLIERLRVLEADANSLG